MVGKCDPWILDKRLAKKTSDYINIRGTWADIGEDNAKVRFISTLKNKRYTSITGDFNYVRFTNNGRYAGKYDTITCLEVLEHLQNPLFFLENIKSLMHKDSVLYLSTPGRMKLLWTDKHFREYTQKELIKWLLSPLDLEVAKTKKIRINHNWKFYFTGIRPFLRLTDKTKIYEIRRST